jgi:TPR repeat protein
VLEIAGRYAWAEHFYDLAGKQAYSAALVNLGYMARIGKGREVDYDRAFNFYMQAAAMGNLRARTNIGTAYILGQGAPKLPEEGVLWYRLAASSGWANAITALGDAYRLGNGVKQDPVQAVALYRAAADTGQIDATANLGQAYVNGEGVAKDVSHGLDLLLGATDKGNQYAPYYAARLFLKGDAKLPADPKRAKKLFELSANRGYALAYLDLAFAYSKGAFSAGKPDLQQAYFNASLAEKFRVNRADEAKSSFAEKLDPATLKKIDAQVDLFVEQNGQ